MEKERILFAEMAYKKISFEQFIDEIKQMGVSEFFSRKSNRLTHEEKSERGRKAVQTRWSKNRGTKCPSLAPKTEQ